MTDVNDSSIESDTALQLVEDDSESNQQDTNQLVKDDSESNQQVTNQSVKDDFESNQQEKEQIVLKLGNRYSLSQLLKYLFQLDPSIDLANSLIRKENAKVESAQSAYYPSLNLDLKNPLVDSEVSSDDRKDALKLELNGSYTIYDFGKRSHNLSANELAKEKQEINAIVAQNDLAYKFINLYIDLLRYRDLAKSSEREVNDFNNLTNLSKTRVFAGASAESDYAQAKYKLAASKSSLSQNKSTYTQMLISLRNLLKANIQLKNLPEKVPNFNHQRCAQISNENLDNPVIAYLRAQSKEHKEIVRSHSSNFYPTVNLDYRYGYKLHKPKEENQVDFFYDDNRKKRTYKYVGLNVSLPIFSGGQISAERDIAEAEFLQNQNNLQIKINESADKRDTSENIISSLSKNIAVLENKVQFSKRTRDLYQTQYINLGTRTLLDLIGAETDLNTSEQDLINAKYDISRAQIECLYQTGQLLKETMN